MSLPVRLGVGLVSIYGAGSINGIINTGQESGIRYGIVNAMYNQYGKTAIGQSVMYNAEDVIAHTFYVDAPYFILPEDKIISVEDNITPP